MKVAIVGGAGGAGASIAYNLTLSGAPVDIVLVDSRDDMITSHLMDLEQALELSPGCSLSRGHAADVPNADVLVVTAAAPLTVNTSRLTYLGDNGRIVDAIADLLPHAWEGVVVLVTNPVDPLVTRFQRRTGLGRRRVLGYTINGSLRLRTGLTKAFGVSPGSVEAWVLGEHGDACVPLLDRITVNGEPRTPTEREAATAVEYLRTWYVRHVALDSGRSSTWTTGLGVARMVLAIVNGDDDLWPASLVLAGEYGIDGVAVSVPVTLGPGGAEIVHEWELTPDQRAALRAGAELVHDITASIDDD